MVDYLLLALAASVVSLLFAGGMALRVRRQSSGTPKMAELSLIIHKGALSFLGRQYKVLSVFVVIVAAVLLAMLGVATAAAFIFGALLSVLAGNIGMRIATIANAKTTEGCRKGINEGLKVAFSSGMVMGMCVVGLGLLGVALSYMATGSVDILFGFSFGASSVALFARVGGGIYTKGADVGADLSGKVEAGIPEDDPRNPAVIADNVGDNVGDVAGMGADLFESYVASIISTMALGILVSMNAVMLPLVLAAIGIISSIIGAFFVRAGRSGPAAAGKFSGPQAALNKGIFASSILMVVLSYFAIGWMLGPSGMGVFWASLSGLAAGIVIGLATQYYTSAGSRPAQRIAEAAKTGASTDIIIGMAGAMESLILPIIAIVAALIISFNLAGLYGVAISAVGMLSTLGITLATDTYGPVADNAAGIAEMTRIGGVVRERAETLDAVGNTTAAIGKGFAIGSAGLTALALFSVYVQTVGLKMISITDPLVIAGLFIGGLMPFLFSSFAMKAVGRTAYMMVEEVRRQFRDKGIMKGTKKPDYHRCIDISTHQAIKSMILPSVITIVLPVAVGLALGMAALGGLLVGATVTGLMLAIFMANAGGAWDNAKKFIEAGHFGGKGSFAHKAAVVGDTVGDPLKDSAGPSLNILIKLISIVALLFAMII
jgi:K(+)-stimulated pyrophosphate-energized sodium pump